MQQAHAGTKCLRVRKAFARELAALAAIDHSADTNRARAHKVLYDKVRNVYSQD